MIAKLLVLSLLLLQTDAPSSPFTGDGLAGGGRICNGILRIYPNYINWETSLSTCDHMPYKTIQAPKDGPLVYEFTQKKRGCIYEVLEVHPGKDGDFWQVDGYRSFERWKTKNNAMDSDCAMY